LWSEIDRKAAAMSVHSVTGAMSDIYESRSSALAELRSRLELLPNQVGAAFAINGRVAGIELFDSPSTCGKYLDKPIDSYSMDALETPASAAPMTSTGSLKEFLDELKRAPIEQYQALGIGVDLRLRGRSVQGAALLAENRIVHLSAYPMNVANDSEYQAPN
jgi:hypothetical protein